ncbi:MAG: galactokinase [Acidobacteria bacterium]|nr:MAG: galactokinase [Acidobacteriota bacterium]REK08861.1 MAG: galactokinase [Acidobacteriota bacterium]
MHSSPLPADAARVLARHREHFGRGAEALCRAPGRVNLLGGHIDYSEGLVLPGAIDRALWGCAHRLEGAAGRVEVLAADLERHGSFALDDLAPPVPQRPVQRADWLDYFRGPATIYWRCAARRAADFGVAITVAGDLPIGIGVSSSAALSVAQLLLLDALDIAANEPTSRLEWARFAQRSENEYLGVQCGLMDPYACLHGSEGGVVLLDCRSETHHEVPFPSDLALLLVDTGVRRRLAGSGFNSRRDECVAAAQALRTLWPELRTLRDVPAEELERAMACVDPPLGQRIRHVVSECERVRRGARALAEGDLETFGAAMRASHASSRDDYEVSIPELDLLADAANEHPGCVGARVSGAGFGGAILAVVHAAQADRVGRCVARRFEQHFARTPRIEQVRIGPGASCQRLV